MRRMLLIIVSLLCLTPAGAQVYERLAARAADHYNHAEWSETIAETDRMVRIHPEDVAPYSMALVAAHYTGDVDTQSRYLVMSQRYGIAIDTLLTHVYNRTRLLHDTKVYEQILLSLKADNAWLARVFNHYLLDYYAFARRIDKTIDIADELLAVSPENVRYAKKKANALFARGDTPQAVEIYEEILRTDSCDYDALTFLGACYSTEADEALAQVDTLYLADPDPTDSVYRNMKQHIIDTRVAASLQLMQRAGEQRSSRYIDEKIAAYSNLTTDLPVHPSHRKSLIMRIKERKASHAAVKEQTTLP